MAAKCDLTCVMFGLMEFKPTVVYSNVLYIILIAVECRVLIEYEPFSLA